MQQFSKGIEFYKAGDFKKAIAAWNSVLAIDPGNQKAKSYIERASTKLELMGE